MIHVQTVCKVLRANPAISQQAKPNPHLVMPVLVVDGKKYRLWVPEEEKQLEELVKKHFSEIFGEDCLYFDIKPELRSQAGLGSHPDAIAIVLDKPSFYVVENERAEHGIHDHIITQVSKFNTAFKKPETRRKITEAVFEEINNDPFKQSLVKSKVKGELYKFLTELFSSKPVVAIIIDEALEELKEAVGELPLESKIVEFRTFVREDAPSIRAHLFEPLIDSSREKETVVTSIDQKKREMIEQIKSDEAKKLLSECLERLELMNLEMKPLSGPWISVWYKGKRFMYISARKKFLQIHVQRPDNSWLRRSNIVSKEDLENTFRNKIEPTLRDFKSKA
jgi:hypothetical protein